MNDVPRHPLIEDFRTYAWPALRAASPWRSGVCFNPDCNLPFSPRREWQIYCCSSCERASVQELRRYGHKLAMPLLVWRLGKYSRGDDAVRNLNNAARRYIGMVQTTWVQDRDARRMRSMEKAR